MAESREPVTFVVPNYNGSRYLGETLASILAQRDDALLVVVVDNRSTDDSVAIAQACGDRRLRVAIAADHVSMSENWNRALGCVQTPLAVLAHADDVYEPDYLTSMRPLLEAHPDAFMAHCAVTNVNEAGQAIDLPLAHYKTRFWPAEDPYCRPPCLEAAWLRQGNYLSAPSALYRMAAVAAIGPFNARLQFVPDWEYWLRGVFRGYSLVGTRRRLVRYRRHASSLTSAAEANLTRYAEEVELLTWIAVRGYEAGCFASAEPDYELVGNTLMSEFADRLVRGDHDGAARLVRFARAGIPGFVASARDVAARCALPLGTAGGRVLAWLRDRYIRHLNAGAGSTAGATRLCW